MERQALTIESDGRDMCICSGPVLVRLVRRDGGYAQELCARDSKGEYRLVLSSIHKDLISFSEHRTSASPMIAGQRPHLFAVCRESLRMPFSAIGIRRPDADRVLVELSGCVQEHELVMRMEIEAGSRIVHVTVEAGLPDDRVIEYLMSSFAFVPDGRILNVDEERPRTWAPCVRPAHDAVIGDAAFFSPAAIVQHEQMGAALIADIDLLSQHRPMSAALDLDADNGLLFAPLLSYGFCGCEPFEGCYRHDITHSRRLGVDRLTYGFHLILDANCKRESMQSQAARFVWRAYGQDSDGAPDSFEHPSPRVALPNITEDGLFLMREPGPEQACYSTVECSELLGRLIQAQTADDRALAVARRYADFLIRLRSRSGAVPCWLTKDLMVVPELRSGAPTAASALFLGRMARITGERKYLAACERSARFVLSEIVPDGLYQDPALQDSRVDPHTGTRPQSHRAMLWVAELCLELHCLLGDASYLRRGTEVLDLLCLAQSVGEKPWMGVASGVLARSNVMPTPDPELSADFAACAMRYGEVTGIAEYSQRGAAAALAAASADSLMELSRASGG